MRTAALAQLDGKGGYRRVRNIMEQQLVAKKAGDFPRGQPATSKSVMREWDRKAWCALVKEFSFHCPV